METKQHRQKHVHLAHSLAGAIFVGICSFGIAWPAIASFEKDKNGVRVSWTQVGSNLIDKYLANMNWANLVGLFGASCAGYNFFKKSWSLYRKASEHDSVPKRTRRLFLEQLDQEEHFTDDVLRSLHDVVEPVMKDAGIALKQISPVFEERLDSAGEFDSTVRQLISCLLTAHAKAQFENLGSGGHQAGKRLLITNFYSYASYVAELIARLRASKPEGFNIWCFSTWSQPIDKWFNYLPGVYGEFHQGQKHWTDYLDFWERELNRNDDRIYIERCVLFTDSNTQKAHPRLPILPEAQFQQSLNKFILVEQHGNSQWKRRPFARAELDAILKSWEIESPGSIDAINHIKKSILESITDGGHAHIILSKDRMTSDLVPPSGHVFLSLREVFYTKFHRSIPGAGVSGALEFQVKNTDADKLGAGAGGMSLPDDLFILGLCKQVTPGHFEQPTALLAIGGDLDIGVHGFGLEFVTGKTDPARWQEVTSWMTDIRKRAVELRDTSVGA